MRVCATALLLSPLLLTLFVQGPSTKLGVKLGPSEAAWQVAPYQGKLDAVAIDGDGKPAEPLWDRPTNQIRPSGHLSSWPNAG